MYNNRTGYLVKGVEKMRICGLQKLSLLDFPEKLAATVFTGGCNLRCPFCHNAPLVTRAGKCDEIPLNDFFSFLQSRKGKLDGVCITGGEPLLQAGLEDFILRIRDMGFLVKLDTNGCFPDKLRILIDDGVLDYVAMDVKNSLDKYAETVGIPDFDTSPVLESISILKEGRVQYEFRTTLVKGLHTTDSVRALGRLLIGAEKYFLQNFADSGDLVGFCPENEAVKCAMDSFSLQELEELKGIIMQNVPVVSIRG